MKLVEGNLSAPGCCFICMRGLGQMIDTLERNDYGVMTPRTGDIYVCQDCVATMAKLSGFIHQDDVVEIAQSAEQVRAEAAGTRELLLEVESLIKSRLAAQAD